MKDRKEEIQMRAPYQVLVIPYKIVDNVPIYCIFKRSDSNDWQFIAGGGEMNESPLEAAKRETFEESGLVSSKWQELHSICYLPITVISKKHRNHWDNNTYVIPEYSFAASCNKDIVLSKEHRDFKWISYEEAVKMLEWDSNKTALFELNCLLTNAIDI